MLKKVLAAALDFTSLTETKYRFAFLKTFLYSCYILIMYKISNAILNKNFRPLSRLEQFLLFF